MTWGFALIWPWQWFQGVEDPWVAKLDKLAEYGLDTAGIGLREWEGLDRPAKDRLAERVARHGLSLTAGFHPRWLDADRAVTNRDLDEELLLLDAFVKEIPCDLVTTSAGGTHRFRRDFPLEEQLERLASHLSVAAARTMELGVRLAIENHGDFYTSDLVRLCQASQGLGIFLDTGNPYLVGERPLEAIQAAAPYTFGTHFKDHFVRPVPDASPIHFEVRGAVLGEGDVPLREAYAILMEQAPEPDRLAMQIELIPPSFQGTDNIDAFERSVEFVRSLS